MPPKVATRSTAAAGAKANAKPTKAAAQQMAMDEAAASALKLYKQHEQQRVESEHGDKVQRDRDSLTLTLEKERLRVEKQAFGQVQKSLADEEKLAFQEYTKHHQWAHIPDASRLPDVSVQRDVNTFLSVWRDREADFVVCRAESAVIASAPEDGSTNHRLHFIRGEQGVPANKRERLIDEELEMCLQAYELMNAILLARDGCAADAATGDSALTAAANVATRGKGGDTMGERAKAAMAIHDENLRNVARQILDSMDFVTANAIAHYDVVLDGADADKETLTRVVPEDEPVFKYGLWVKVKEVTRSFTSLVFPQIDVRLDPKANALPRLPKALGLSKENVGVRALQFSFNPFVGYDLRGNKYYALDCTVKVDLLGFTHRPRELGEWQMRSETAEQHTLQCEEYPPRNAEARSEDPAFRVSFDVPQTIVVRQPSVLIGKWVEATREWEPCSHVVFGATLSAGGAGARAEASGRRATFTTGELAHFAVLQERVFDAPYERWSIRPVSYDQVVVTLEGRHRGETGDRVFDILVENTQCKLLSPDDSELRALRESWVSPVTLLRALAQAGFNFLLHDEDAKYLHGVLPKSAALEAKAYADIALFCQYHAVSSTRHNRGGEDPDMALFRLSKVSREVDEEYNPYDNTPLPTEGWHHIRYHTTSCVRAAFTDDQNVPDLNVLAGEVSHYNLYSLLYPIVGEDVLGTQLVNTNYLLRRCVLQLLQLARPLSWG